MNLIQLEIQQKLSMELTMAPHIIQSMKVLTLPALELQNFIQEQLEANPVLESDELFQEDKEMLQKTVKETEDNLISDDFLSSFGNLERGEEKFYSINSAQKYTYREKDLKMEAMQNTPERSITLQDYLFNQFQLIEIPEKLRAFGKYIIYNIDSKGYLRYSLEEIINSIDAFWTMEEAEEVLEHIQKLEPLGIGARNIQECLLLQLDREDPNFYFKKMLITKHLLDIGKNRYPEIVKKTGKNLEEIKKIVGLIQKLNPKPGASYFCRSTPFIMLDIVAEMVDGEYVTRLEKNYLPYLKIDSMYSKSLKSFNKETKKFVKEKLISANWVIEAIKQRQNTLCCVAKEIVKKQKSFLQNGLLHLNPLKMEDISKELQIHISTVSRAVSGKYIQTPQGIFPLKFFFTRGISKKNGTKQSRVAVQERIQKLINLENKKLPLSDEEIVIRLKGLEIARRTVTKYRKVMGIPCSNQRKQY